MSDPSLNTQTVRFYFVDEAGDGILFSAKGHFRVGTPGCSSHFILGKMDVANPERLRKDLESLRRELLSDPYYRNVPSMQPQQRKTALAFHAKDDLPEIRREVFRILSSHEMTFFAVVRDKRAILEKVLKHQKQKPGYHYHPNQLYDRCVTRLFQERLHKDEGYTIWFAKRGKRDRTEALQKALEAARHKFRRKWGIAGTAPIEIIPATPQESAGLQAVDYFLWALQRYYSKKEDRFLAAIWPKIALVHDVDDSRDKGYGVYYSQRNPMIDPGA